MFPMSIKFISVLHTSLIIPREVELVEANPYKKLFNFSFDPSAEDDAAAKAKGLCNHVSTCSLTKASVQQTAPLSTTVVGSPSASLCAPAPDKIAATSHSGVTIPSVPRNRKAVAPNTSATSWDRSSSLSLIENVDMGNLIEDLMSTKVPLPADRRIQKFLTNVCVSFICLSHSFYEFSWLISHSFFLIHLHFCSTGWSGPCSIEHQAKG